jgi:hypothetical protein
MSDLIADGWAEIFFHVQSWPRTVCPRLHQGPIGYADETFVAMTSLCRELGQHHKYFKSNLHGPGGRYFSSPGREAGHIRNADEDNKVLPKPILKRTNGCQNVEDEKSQKRHFRIEPLGQ